MNKYKVGYVLTSLLDYGLTFGGTMGIIIYNYVDPDNSESFKITITGIILVIAMLYSCKTIFEHNYQNKQNTLLQQLATTPDELQKEIINKQINTHKMINRVYSQLTKILPFAIIYVITYLGAVALEDLHGTVGMILACMGGGAVFNVAKIPLQEKANSIKVEKKAIKKRLG